MSLFRCCAVTAVALTGCASAGKPGFGHRPDGGIVLVDSGGGGGGHDSSGGGGTDSGGGGMIDAPTQGGTQTLSQTTSPTDTGNALACGDGATYTTKQSFYRVFALSDYSITGAFNVTQVDFPVSSATNGPQLKITVGTYTGTVGGATLPGTITPVATAMVTPADTDTSESVPITATIPAGSNLVVEVDQTNKGDSTNKIMFYIGGNTDGEMAPGYISASDCGATTPTSMTQESMAGGGDESDLILTVTGST